MAFAPIFQRTFSATFDRRAAVAAAGNGLLNALIAYWPGNEASGDLLDAHTNALHLTDTNTVTNATGKVYATARQYTAANIERHVRAGDDALLSGEDADITIAAWVYLDNKSAERWIVTKWAAAVGSREYMLRYNNATDRFEVYWRNVADNAYGIAVANNLGAVSTGAWYLLVAWHDSGNNQVGIQANNGTVDLTSGYSGGVQNGTIPFQISGYSGVASPFDGRIGPVAMWKSAAGGGGVLTAAQRSSLYNAGNGLAYAQFTT